VEAGQTLQELARDLSMLDLVPMVECAATMSDCDVEAVLADAPRQMPGRARLARAIALAEPRSETWWETMLRLLHDLAGIATEVQPDIRSELGTFIGRADLRIVGTVRLVEHDGDSHRPAERHRTDLARDRALARNGMERYGYTSHELMYRPAGIVADAERALGLEHSPRLLRIWLREARLSTLTGSGRQRLADRLRRYVRAAQRAAPP
jgi:hypothetical protein